MALDGRFNVERLTSALTARGIVKKASPNGAYYLLPEEHGVIATISAARWRSPTPISRSWAASPRSSQRWPAAPAAEAVPPRQRPRTRRRPLDPHATAWAVVDVQRAQRITGAPRMSTEDAAVAGGRLRASSVSTVALWATDNGDSLKLGAFGLSQRHRDARPARGHAARRPLGDAPGRAGQAAGHGPGPAPLHRGADE